MINVQNNFGYLDGSLEGVPPPELSVPFTSANTRGNGLMVVAVCMAQPAAGPPALTPINITVRDSAGNSYVRIGGCGGFDLEQWTAMLVAWYAPSCAGGPNTVTVADTLGATDYVLAASVFECPGALDLGDAALGSRFGANEVIALSVSASAAATLLFAYGVSCGTATTVSLYFWQVAGSFPSHDTEQAEMVPSWAAPYPTIASTLAVAGFAGTAGVATIEFVFSSTTMGLQLAVLAAMSLTAVPGSPAPPGPGPGPSTPLPSLSSGVWPTIF